MNLAITLDIVSRIHCRDVKAGPRPNFFSGAAPAHPHGEKE